MMAIGYDDKGVTDRVIIDAEATQRHAAVCSKCSAAIFWGRTMNGKPIPINFEPTPNGNLIIAAVGPDPNRMGSTAYWIARYLPLDDPNGDEPRYTSHFATCKFADEFRRRGRK